MSDATGHVERVAGGKTETPRTRKNGRAVFDVGGLGKETQEENRGGRQMERGGNGQSSTERTDE